MWTKPGYTAPQQAEAPDQGRRLATLARANGEELRVEISTYNGYEFLNLRVWARSPEGRMIPLPKKGLALKTRELREVAAALLDAADELEGQDPRGQQQPPARGRRPGSAPARRPTPDPTESRQGFDEFDDAGGAR